MKPFLPILILSLNIICQGQETIFHVYDNLDMVLKPETVKVDTNEIYLMRMNIINNSDFSYLFWFSEINTVGMTQKEIILYHFYKTKGDFNLIQLANKTITNTTKLPSNAFAVFTKVINKKMNYNFNIIVKNQITNKVKDSIIDFVINHAVIIPENITREYFDIKSIEKIIDKSKSSFMEWGIIKHNIQN